MRKGNELDSSAKALSLLINTEIKSGRTDKDVRRVQLFQEEQAFTHSSPKMLKLKVIILAETDILQFTLHFPLLYIWVVLI